MEIKRFVALIVVIGACLAPFGCGSVVSNPKEASKKNFEKAINEHLAESHKALISFQSSGYGNLSSLRPDHPIKELFASSENENIISDTLKKKLELLVDIGYLEEKKIEKDDWKRTSWGRKTKTPITYYYREYSLTQKGAGALTRTVQSGCLIRCGLSAGVARVKEILSYTEPSSMMGMIVSEVEYTYTVDLHPWAEADGAVEAFKKLEPMVKSKEEPIKDEKTLVLKNTGWVPWR